MKTLLVPKFSSLATDIIESKMGSLTDSINEYCVKKFVDAGLGTSSNIPKPFTGVPDVVMGGLSLASVAAVKKSVFKMLSKNIPYVKSATLQYVDSGPTVSSRAPLLSFMFKDRADYLPASVYEHLRNRGSTRMDDYRIAQVSSTRNIVEVYVKETSSLSRYVRFLNYQFRKYRIPAMANMSVTLECPTTEYEKFEDPDVRKEDVRVKFHLVKKIEITHAKWVSDRSGTVTVLTANDSQLAQGNLWAPVPVRNITFNTPEQNFCPDPHLFKYLNQLITISNTLSRKLTYGPDAFNYGVEQQG